MNRSHTNKLVYKVAGIATGKRRNASGTRTVTELEASEPVAVAVATTAR